MFQMCPESQNNRAAQRREPEQQDHTEKEPGCKALAFLDSEQQKRQTYFFQNMDTDSGLSMYGKEFSEIIYGNASCYVFF